MIQARKVLIKLKSGRHRVATAHEITLLADVGAAERKVDRVQGDLRRERMTIDQARADGVRMAMESKEIPYAMRMIADHLGEALGKELLPHAQKLMAADQTRRRKPFEVRTAFVQQENMTYLRIHGVIPELHYAVQLATVGGMVE